MTGIDETAVYVVTYDVELSARRGHKPTWARDSQVAVVARDELTAAFTAGSLCAPRHVENVRVHVKEESE